jgi:hypothetical protein
MVQTMNRQPAPYDSQPLSIVANARRVRTADTSLKTILDGIKAGQWQDAVSAVRQADTAKAVRACKLKLPAVMFAGTFTRRANGALADYSSLLCLDVDHVDVEETRPRIIADPHTLAAFVSPSGKGIKVVVPLDNTDPQQHGAAFNAVSRYYWQTLNIEVDSACRDLARLCFVSYDPALFWNPKPNLFTCHIDHIDHTDNIGKVCDTLDVAAVIDATQPRKPGERHRCVFNLARGLKLDAGMHGASFDELRPHVKAWFDKALPNIATKHFSESWSDFIHAWPRASTPLSHTPLEEAFRMAIHSKLPAVCNSYDGEGIKTLLAVCWHLKSGDGTFYLSTHIAAARLYTEPKRILRYFRMFETDGLFKTVKKGNRTKATVYKWTKTEADFSQADNATPPQKGTQQP